MGTRGSNRQPYVNRLLLRAAALAALLATAPATLADDASAEAPTDATVVADPARAALIVSGPIGPRFEPDVQESLRRHPKTRTLIVRSPGGLRAPALRIGQLANRRGITVRIAGRCSSACALLWAAAESREMTLDSRVGLHQSRLDDGLALPDTVRREIMARNDRQTDEVLRKAGFPEHVIARGAATPPTTMSWFGPQELLQGGVPFELLDTAGQSLRASATLASAGAAPAPGAAASN